MEHRTRILILSRSSYLHVIFAYSMLVIENSICVWVITLDRCNSLDLSTTKRNIGWYLLLLYQYAYYYACITFHVVLSISDAIFQPTTSIYGCLLPSLGLIHLYRILAYISRNLAVFLYVFIEFYSISFHICWTSNSACYSLFVGNDRYFMRFPYNFRPTA